MSTGHHLKTIGEAHRTGIEDKCLYCGTPLNAASGLETEDTAKRGPKPGDATVCIACGHIMAFGDDMRMRELTEEEIKEFAGRAEIVEFNDMRQAEPPKPLPILEIWTVYKHPKDYPDKFVARKWLVGKNGLVATDDVFMAYELKDVLQSLPPGLAPLPRFENDDPCIVGCWL